jgi:hypothetical protein
MSIEFEQKMMTFLVFALDELKEIKNEQREIKKEMLEMKKILKGEQI